MGGFGVAEVIICCGAVLILLVMAMAVFAILWLTKRSKNRAG
jgi:hypothetical protein